MLTIMRALLLPIVISLPLVACAGESHDAALRARVARLERQVAELSAREASRPSRSSCARVVDASVPPGTRFTYDVAVAPTTSNLATGDAVTIRSVRGTRADLAPGGDYVVRGTYTLASADVATLALNVTAVRSGEGCSRNDGQDELAVRRGSGSFELRERMPYPGKPHLTFYVAGQAHGGMYFAAK